MRASELMIGDWVRVADTLEVRVVALSRRKILADNGCWYEQFEPVPLTAEILEKNGFELMNESEVSPARFGRKPGVWQYGFGQFDSVAYVPEQSFLRIKFMEGYTADIANIKYVHELQHALRLCGIDKEVVL